MATILETMTPADKMKAAFAGAKKVTEEILKKAEKKIIAGRTQVIFFKAVFAPLIFKLEPKAVEYLPTMATDGRSLLYNPNFVMEQSVEHLKFAILHEVLHCALRHPPRRGFRDPELWNICCDLVVNAILVYEESMAHPNWIILDKKYWKKPDGTSWTVEEIYDELYKKIETAKAQYKLQCPCVQKDLTAQHGAGDGEGKETSGGCAHRDPRGWTDVSWDKGLEEDWKQAVIASDQMARMRGNSPAWLKTLVDDLVEPPVPIEKILQHIIGNIVSNETTWKCPNRRFVSRGQHLPSMIKDRKDGIIAIDTSGSIGDDEAKDFLGIAVRAMQTKGINELRVIQCDAEIKDDTRTKDVTTLKLHIKKTGIRGRGGTAFEPVFEKIEKENPWGVSFMIYLTDLNGSFPTKKARYPVFWITIDKNPVMVQQAKLLGKVYYWDRKGNKVEVLR